MARIGFVADPHVGNHRRFAGATVAGVNDRCRQHLEVLAKAGDLAKQERCGALVILGDLFDSSNPTPQVVAATQKALKDVPTVVVTGNHDIVSAAQGDHACAPLEPVADVVDTPTVLTFGDEAGSAGVALWCIPFRPGDAREWLPRELEALAAQHSAGTGHRVLALHLGIEDKDTAPFLKGAHDAIPVDQLLSLMVEHEIVAAFAGNWHRRQKWGDRTRTVLQVGTLAPAGLDDSGLVGYGTLAVLDTGSTGRPKVFIHEIPGPRFMDLSSPAYDPDEAKAAHDAGCTIYARVTVPPGESLSAHQAAEGTFFAGVDVRPDTAEANAAARNAAAAARSAATLDEALHGFVSQMDLPDGVSHDAVLAAAKSYLAGRK